MVTGLLASIENGSAVTGLRQEYLLQCVLPNVFWSLIRYLLDCSMPSRTYWRNAISQLSEAHDADGAAVHSKCISILSEATGVHGMSCAQAYYELVAAPRWTRQGVERNDQVVSALTQAASELGLQPAQPIEVDGVRLPLLERLEADAQLAMGFGEPASVAIRVLRHCAS
jgi:hypothetical protein